MRTTTIEKLADLQKSPSSIRNICILAHVDHGKTTLADALVASNGIISQRMAGKLRYMDSREDEQVRGITMKSSAISLTYDKDDKKYLVNLIDSPGHVDFSSEVSTAVRLCDGAIVVVDVVEGVCPQTHAVLRQAWLENLKPVLVLNKLDRLILELKMDPLEAFFRLQHILQEINLVTSELFTSEAMEKTSNQTNGTDKDEGEQGTQSHDWMEDLEEGRNIYFSPDQGNVIFASAYDGWGFTVGHFADIFSKKLGINEEVLSKTLWGDFYLNSKTKRVMKGAQSKAKKPMFVQFVLESIWAVYDAVCVSRDKEKTDKIVKSLGLKVSTRDTRHTDSRVYLQAITSQWLPVSDAVLDVVVDKLPSPLETAEDRVEKLMCPQARSFQSLPQETQDLKKAFLGCSAAEDVPVIVFVSKMFPVEKKMLPQNRPRPLTEEEIQQRRAQARERHAQRQANNDTPVQDADASSQSSLSNGVALQPADDNNDERNGADEKNNGDHVFVAFARVFSGTVRKGQTVYVLGPKHDPSKVENMNIEDIPIGENLKDLDNDTHVTRFTVKDIYLFMGRELEYMDNVPAGNILGIGGLDDHILKSATLSTTVMCPPFTDLYFDAFPILRVALEPKHAGEMRYLVEGLKLLNQADPCVQVLVQETGEHVIITAGEIHLQRCLDDLKDRYANIKLNASEPIVPFRETIVHPPKLDMVNEAVIDNSIKVARAKQFEGDEEVLGAGLVEAYTANRKCCIRVKAVPLPDKITSLLEDNQELLKTLHQCHTVKGFIVKNEVLEALNDLKDKLKAVLNESGKLWRDSIDSIWAFGPKRVGPNILLNRIEDYNRPSIWNYESSESQLREFDNGVVSGFQIATLAGPLCEEPMRGLCFIIEKWKYENSSYASIARLSESENISDMDSDKIVDLLSSVTLDVSDSALNKDCECVGAEAETLEETTDGATAEENCDNDKESESKGDNRSRRREIYGPFSGQLISCVKDSCRKAFQTQPQRLMAAMYKCNIQATSEVLGKLYGVLGKRDGRVLEEDMKEGSQLFNIIATLPVMESFGFSESIRKKTSGLASPQLVFSHWEVIDVDPFWVPTTDEEYLHFGEKADSENRARRYMNKVRKRKGLKVDEKIVQHAEKQRTLTKMK